LIWNQSFFFSANSSAWAIAEMFESGATRSEVQTACARWGAVNEDNLLVDEIIKQMIAEVWSIRRRSCRSRSVRTDQGMDFSNFKKTSRAASNESWSAPLTRVCR